MKTTLTLVIAASAALFLQAGAHAQGTTDGPGSTFPASSSWQPASQMLDYSHLYNTDYNNIDIQTAKAMHLSDYQIARTLKISRLVGIPFRQTLTQIANGMTFTALSEKYGFNMAVIRSVKPEEDEIDAYEAAYSATGRRSAKRHLLNQELMKQEMMQNMHP